MVLRSYLYTAFGFIMMTAMMFLGAQAADAVTYYYVGTTDAYATAGSWHSADKACDDAGDGLVPSSGDTIKMGASCDTVLTTPVAETTLASVVFEAGYTGTVTQGGDLIVTGAVTIVSGATFDVNSNALDVGGNWTNAGIIAFTGPPGTVTFDGASGTQTVITGGTGANFDFGHVIIANTGDGVLLSTNGLKTNGDFTINSGSTLNSAGLDLMIGGNYSNSGTYTSGANTVTFTAQGAEQTVTTGGTSAGFDFNNVVIADGGGGFKTITATNAMAIDGNLTIDSGAKLDSNGLALTVSGNWTNDSDYFSGVNTVTFDGASGTQAIVTGGTGTGNDFNNVVINNTGTAVQLSTNNIDIDGTLTITAGVFDINALNATIVGAVSNDGTFKLDGSETVSWTNDINSGIVLYDGSGTYAELKAGDTYFNLTFNGTGNWTLDAVLNVDGAFTITAGTIITGGNAITVAGNWANAGTFTSGANTVTFDGGTAQTIVTGGVTAAKDFNNLVVTGTGTVLSITTNDLLINGTLTIAANSTLVTQGNGLEVTGVYSNEGRLRMVGNETIDLTNDVNSGETHFIDAGGGSRNLNGLTTFYTLIFNDTGSGATWTLAANIDVNGDLQIAAGTLAATGAFDIALAGDWTNSDIFTHGSGLVTLDGTSQTIAGSTTFYDLTKSVSSADTLTLTAATTTTVSNILTLNGVNAGRLTIASSTPATAANLTANGTDTVSYLTVSDNANAGSIVIECHVGCTNAGNNTGWFFANAGSGTSGSVSSTVTTASVLSPNGGGAYVGGEVVNVTWSVSGDDVDSIRLGYSVDNGQTYTVISSGEANDGTYSWTVPNLSATNAKVRVTGVSSVGGDVVSDVSNQSFSISLTPGLVVVDPVADDVAETTVVSMTDTSGNLVNLVEGSLFRGVELSGVYMVKDGTRYVFPTEAVFFSYGYSFGDVVNVQDDQLRKLKLGGRMIMAEGKMIKIQSDNRVYQVQADGTISHVPDEATAIALYGSTWNKQITDISVVFWFDYTIGNPLASQQ